MTNKDAVEILHEERRINAEIFGLQFFEALDMAIEALESLEKLEKAYKSDYQIQDLIEVGVELWG